jgi:tetratricopeptide (TPR) repeat protein
MSLPADFFIAGGTLRAQAPSYVMRLADQELFEHTLAGEFCYVLTPRQMGKSSLMIRTARRLAEAGRTVAILDLTGIGSGSADQWYLGLLEQIARDLRLNIDVPDWWQARASLAIPQRFSDFLRDVVLQEIASPVVIFIDEIDSTLNFNFRDDFFAAIRAIYNARATESAYKRLAFALLGVATPTDLIHDRERTPFNIGRRIILQEFSYDEAESLKAGLEVCHPGQSDVILRRIFDWTNGYPYLTQKLCLAVVERPATHWDATQVDELVEAIFFSDTGRKDPNFKFVQQRIQESSVAARRQMLNLYRKVYNDKSVPDDDRSQSQNHLELYGLVRVERGKLNVRNDTYRRIFDQKWIEANMPANRDLRLAIGASLAALLVLVAVWFLIRQTPSPSASLYVKQFNDNAFPTARIEALAGLFNLQDGLYDRDDEQGLSLFYNLGPHDQLDFFGQANARAKGREMVTAIRRVSLTLDEQDANDLAMMGEMITALGVAGQPGTDVLVKELTNWKSGRELAGKGQYEDATTAYSATIQLNPDNLAARYDRASVFINLARYSEALADFNQIIGMAKTAAPTPTSVFTVTNTLPPTSAIDTPTRTLLSSSAVPTITATPIITPTGDAVSSKSRFVTTDLIIKTVADTIRENKGLLNYLQDSQNQTAANQALIGTLGLSNILSQLPSAAPINIRSVQGVKSAYLYTNRINSAGPYTRMRAEPNVASAPIGMLYNGDTVGILRDDVAGWYQLRIHNSSAPEQNGATGWIERWLIDDVGVPPVLPSPTPLPVVRFSARVDVTFEGSGTTGQFRSCIAGRVRAADGNPYAGAQVNVNNGPKNSFNARTGRDGVYRVCGLGPSHWDVVLRQVPGMALAQQPSGVVYLNGDVQEALVHFFRQP